MTGVGLHRCAGGRPPRLRTGQARGVPGRRATAARAQVPEASPGLVGSREVRTVRAPSDCDLGSDRFRERLPYAALHGGRRGPALLHATADDRHLVRVELRRRLQHVERFLAGRMLAPLEHVTPRRRDALVDLVEHDVLVTRRPALTEDVDAVHERHADEIGGGEVVSLERVHLARGIEAVGQAAPGASVEADFGDAAGEDALEELAAEGLPTVEARIRERAPLEARLTRTNGGEVGVVEVALAEDALAPTREERLEAAIERLTAEVAALEDAALRRDGVERRAPEIRVTDRDAVEHQDALHGAAFGSSCRLRRRVASARCSTGARPSWSGPRR